MKTLNPFIQKIIDILKQPSLKFKEVVVLPFGTDTEIIITTENNQKYYICVVFADIHEQQDVRLSYYRLCMHKYIKNSKVLLITNTIKGIDSSFLYEMSQNQEFLLLSEDREPMGLLDLFKLRKNTGSDYNGGLSR